MQVDNLGIVCQSDRKLCHPTQSIDERNVGSLVLKLKAGALDGVKRWVMRFGTEAEVLSPRELRDMIRSEAEALRELYR